MESFLRRLALHHLATAALQPTSGAPLLLRLLHGLVASGRGAVVADLCRATAASLSGGSDGGAGAAQEEAALVAERARCIRSSLASEGQEGKRVLEALEGELSVLERA